MAVKEINRSSLLFEPPGLPNPLSLLLIDERLVIKNVNEADLGVMGVTKPWANTLFWISVNLAELLAQKDKVPSPS